MVEVDVLNSLISGNVIATWTNTLIPNMAMGACVALGAHIFSVTAMLIITGGLSQLGPAQ
jgi:hypothetical protein